MPVIVNAGIGELTSRGVFHVLVFRGTGTIPITATAKYILNYNSLPCHNTIDLFR